MNTRIKNIFYLTVVAILSSMSTISVVSAQENITEISISPTGPLQVNAPVKVTAHASGAIGEVLYYKFYYCANYGTADYASTPWIVVQEYSTTNSADYYFPKEGNYMVIVRAVTDPNNEPVALPIIGQTVSVGVNNDVNIANYSINFASRPNAYDNVTVTAKADSLNGQNVYYKFYYCANYGTDSYFNTPWTVVKEYSTANSAVYSFPAKGDYIVIVRAVTDPNNEPIALPIIGGVVSVNADAGFSLTAPTGVWASQGTYPDKIVSNWNTITRATGYNVYYSNNYSGAYQYLGTTTTTSGVHSSLPLGTTYFYKITATSGSVESPLSAIFSGFTATNQSRVGVMDSSRWDLGDSYGM